jgi:hypothetical protein
MITRIIGILCAFFLLSFPSDAAERLTTAQIKALAPGTYVGTWKNKLQLNLRLLPNGTVAGTVDGVHRSGTWYASDGNLCLVFKILIFEKTKCGAIARDGRWLIGYYNKKGQPRIRLRATEMAKA